MGKKLFKDIEIGEHFGCYGDTYLNYSSPVWIIAIKLNRDGAAEVNRENQSAGVAFLMSRNDELEFYGAWKNVPKTVPVVSRGVPTPNMVFDEFVHPLTDCEKLKALFTELGIEFSEFGRGEIIVLELQVDSEKVEGYGGFFCQYHFDRHGKFIVVKIKE